MHFLHKAHHSLLVLRNTSNTSALCLEIILNSEITNRNLKNHHHNKTWHKWVMKRTRVYNMRVETRRQNLDLFRLIQECVHRATQSFPCPVCVHSDCESAVSIDLGVTKKC